MSGSLDGSRVHVLGRLPGLTRKRIGELVSKAGGRLARELTPGVTVVVVAHGQASRLRAGGLPAMLFRVTGPRTSAVSEETFRRLLGTRPPLPDEPREVSEEKLLDVSGIDPLDLYWLKLFDVLEPVDGLYAFRDLVVARDLGRLLHQGTALADLIVAAVELRRQGTPLAEVRLAPGPGGLVRLVSGRAEDFGGQMLLPLTLPGLTADEAFALAERFEAGDRLEEAERLYETACLLDPRDPVLPFNLGNVLREQGRLADAIVWWQRALERDSGFAEADFNIAMTYEDAGDPSRATTHYLAALKRRPDFADAAYNLARLLEGQGWHRPALDWWTAYLTMDPKGSWADKARRHAALCRMELRSNKPTAC